MENNSIVIEPKWRWDVFGNGMLTVDMPREVSLGRRIITRIFLGSKWTDLRK